MIENKTSKEETENDNFAELLEESIKTIRTGEKVKGEIIAITAGELQVDIGTKVTGIVPYSEVADDSGLSLAEAFKVGDEIEAIVIKVSDKDGVATLSKKKIDSKQKWKKISEAYNEDKVIEGEVTEVIKGGVLLKYESSKIFVPASQTGISKDGDLGQLVGKTVKAKIIEINEGKKRAVASIRKVTNEERKQKEAEFWANVEEGKQYEGEVKSLTSYGAFVDLGGVDGMVHTTELSWSRIKSPAEVVSVGEVIKVYVKDYNAETKRISLGYKTEETNPWKMFRDKYSEGDVAEVKVVNIMPFGAFAEIIPGADGLIHISQIADRKIGNPGEVLEVGQKVEAKIIGIDDEKQQVSLSIRALLETEGEEFAEEPVEEISEETFEETAE